MVDAGETPPARRRFRGSDPAAFRADRAVEKVSG